MSTNFTSFHCFVEPRLEEALHHHGRSPCKTRLNRFDIPETVRSDWRAIHKPLPFWANETQEGALGLPLMPPMDSVLERIHGVLALKQSNSHILEVLDVLRIAVLADYDAETVLRPFRTLVGGQVPTHLAVTLCLAT